MEQMNFHKSKLYALIIAGVALVAVLLPWIKADISFFGVSASNSANGFRDWGLLSVLGIAAIAALCFFGDKAAPFLPEHRNYVLGGFGAMAAGALIFWLSNISGKGEIIKSGIGLWICLFAGLAGLGITLGFIKVPVAETPRNPM